MNHILILLLVTLLSSCGEGKVKTAKEQSINNFKTSNGNVRSFAQGIADCLSATPPARANCIEGAYLPVFQTTTNSDEDLDSKDLMGKPTVINLWFIGCPPCEAEIPGFNQLKGKYGDDVNFVAIGRNSKSKLDKYLENQKWDFVHINDPGSELLQNQFKHQWGYPTTYIADSNGVIRKAFSGGSIGADAADRIVAHVEPTLMKLLGE